ncbi:MAG TPA: hypothetical protein VF659_09140 [Pyrinomonadaceae bacterium]|jgi:hypothetical protein
MSVSFNGDIKPLFRTKDINCMNGFGVQLADYGYMSDPAGDGTYPDHANANHVYAHLAGTETPRMPTGGPFWDQSQLDLYRQWMSCGFQQ